MDEERVRWWHRTRYSLLAAGGGWACTVAALWALSAFQAELGRHCFGTLQISGPAPALALAGLVAGAAAFGWAAWQLGHALFRRPERERAGHTVLAVVVPIVLVGLLGQATVLYGAERYRSPHATWCPKGAPLRGPAPDGVQ
ncbi:hypothetical protein GCM10009759_11720 [Kitasatospora saccharophila]|uniref:Uncharacterized protein n=1 Tax=Kitasatospora saccharophila TaxID=407973 RepID=A0ABN2WD43_9ACTN